MSGYSVPSREDDPVHTVRTIGRIAQIILELRDEYVARPRPEILSQIDQRLEDLLAQQDDLASRLPGGDFTADLRSIGLDERRAGRSGRAADRSDTAIRLCVLIPLRHCLGDGQLAGRHFRPDQRALGVGRPRARRPFVGLQRE